VQPRPQPTEPVTPPAVVVAPPEDVNKPVDPEPQPTEPENSTQPTVNAKPKPRVAPESMPDSVREDLAAAQKALDASNTAEALRHIRRSQRTKITGLSFSLLTRVYCQQHDLANSRAQWTRVPATERPRVRQYCSQYDIDL
ncbi:serine/threonine protein kinase, partial [Corallococcus exiguus]|nr:serine/threonine protein kinase [Corallococcus exiguus]NPC52760.1 serine/threonine protein kinase [Corallococcus exiguus]